MVALIFCFPNIHCEPLADLSLVKVAISQGPGQLPLGQRGHHEAMPD